MNWAHFDYPLLLLLTCALVLVYAFVYLGDRWLSKGKGTLDRWCGVTALSFLGSISIYAVLLFDSGLLKEFNTQGVAVLFFGAAWLHTTRIYLENRRKE